MASEFGIGKSVHLKGNQMLTRLSLDYDQETFVYTDPITKSVMPVEGLMQVVIALPKKNNLRNVPFIPFRHQSKTYRAECKSCLLSHNFDVCPHDLKQRSFCEVLATCEVAYAVVSLSYVLLEVQEALIYTEKTFLFKDYMKLLAAKKVQHQPVPEMFKDCLQNYCDEINDSLALSHDVEKLKPSSFQENKAEAMFAKSLMNISLGKLAQRKNLGTTEFIDCPSRFSRILSDPTLNLKHVFMVSQDLMQATYESHTACVKRNVHGQFILSGCLTAKARIILDKNMRKVLANPDNILCFVDTDSIAYVCQHGEPDVLKLHHSKLGYFKSEIPQNLYVKHYRGLSPKNYLLAMADKKTDKIEFTSIKIRGLMVKSASVQSKLNLDVLTKMISELQQGRSHVEKVPQFHMKLDGQDRSIRPLHFFKKYSNTAHTKRFFRPDKSLTKTYAFGLASFEA